MKKILYIFFVALFTTFGCQKLEDVNENPNNVAETHPKLLLTKLQWDAFQVQGVSPMFASRMVVQTDGEQEEQYYKWDRAGFGEYNNLRNAVKMMEEAERIDSDPYRAMAKFFRAFYFYNITLRFGDIPYSQALRAEVEEIYTPAYDTQKEVFTGILKELEEANNLLDENDIIEGDIVFIGSGVKWKRAINAFRLKVLLTLSHRAEDSDMNIKSAFASIVDNQPLPESNDDNLQLEFVDQLGNRYTEFNSSGYGSARYMDSTFIERLRQRNDPRLFIYSDQTPKGQGDGLAIDDFSGYDGGNPVAFYETVNAKAADGLVSKVDLRYTTDPVNEPHVILGYAELQYILSEAAVRGWISGDAQMYYEEGVKANFSFYNMYAENYAQYVDVAAAGAYLQEPLVAFSAASTDDEKIALIITQKYLQSFLQGGWTAYFEHLRTGYPEFALPAPSVTPPSRWMYPNSELLENTQNVEAAIMRQFGAGNDGIRQLTWWLK